MKKLGKVTLRGASGASYPFSVYPWESAFAPEGAVYVVTRRREKGGGRYAHLGLYAGQTADLAACVADHRRSSMLRSRDPNCVCVHSEAVEATRLQIESDLICSYGRERGRSVGPDECEPQERLERLPGEAGEGAGADVLSRGGPR